MSFGQEIPAEYILRGYKGSDWYWDFQLLDDNDVPIPTAGLELKLHMQFTKTDGSSEVKKLTYPGVGITAINLATADFRARINKADLLDYCAGEGTYDFDWKASGLEERLIAGVLEIYDGVDPSD